MGDIERNVITELEDKISFLSNPNPEANLFKVLYVFVKRESTKDFPLK